LNGYLKSLNLQKIFEKILQIMTSYQNTCDGNKKEEQGRFRILEALIRVYCFSASIAFSDFTSKRVSIVEIIFVHPNSVSFSLYTTTIFNSHINWTSMSKHHPDLVLCRKLPGIAIGRLCEKCDGKCPLCDSHVRPSAIVRICEECNFGSYGGRCIVCGNPGISVSIKLLFLRE
jgi:PHF5-like protein